MKGRECRAVWARKGRGCVCSGVWEETGMCVQGCLGWEGLGVCVCAGVSGPGCVCVCRDVWEGMGMCVQGCLGWEGTGGVCVQGCLGREGTGHLSPSLSQDSNSPRSLPVLACLPPLAVLQPHRKALSFGIHPAAQPTGLLVGGRFALP